MLRIRRLWKNKKVKIIILILIFFLCSFYYRGIIFIAKGSEITWQWIKLMRAQRRDSVATKRRDTLINRFDKSIVEFVSATDTRGETLLHLSAGNGYEIFCRYLIFVGAPIDHLNDEGLKPIHYAAMNGQTESYFVLKDHSPYVDLLSPARTGNLDLVKAMVIIDPTITEDPFLLSKALYEAARSPNLKMIEFLIAHGAMVNFRNERGGTPLSIAVIDGNVQNCELLLAHGADPNIHIDPGEEATTPLHLAVSSDYNEIVDHNEIIKLLLYYGADIEARDIKGMTPLVRKVCNLIDDVRGIETLRLLLKFGADISAQDKEGLTALHWAARSWSPKPVKFLVSNGADVNSQDKRGRTPLHFLLEDSPKNGNLSGRISLLLSLGAQVNALDHEGKPPLFYSKETSVVDLLISYGADVKARDNQGRTVLHHAADAKQFSDEKLLTLLIAKGADVNARDHEGKTPLFYFKNKYIIYLLISQGADVNARDNLARTVLHYAAYEKDFEDKELLTFLVSRGADVNARDQEGRTPLHYCVLQDNYDFLFFLIENSAKTNIRDHSGKTPYGLALETNRPDMAAVLQQHGGRK